MWHWPTPGEGLAAGPLCHGHGLPSQLSPEKTFLKKDCEGERSQYHGSGQAGLGTKRASFGPSGGKFCPKLTKAAGFWQSLSWGATPSPWWKHVVMATTSMTNPLGVSEPKTEIWRKGSKSGFFLRTISSTCNEKALNKWVVKACFSAYGLDQLQPGGR